MTMKVSTHVLLALLLLCVQTADTEAIDQGEGRDTIPSPTRYPSNTPDITDSESDQKPSQEIPAINTDTIPTKESFIDNHQMTKTSGPIASRTLFSTEDSVVTHDRGESDGAVRARRGNVDRQQRSALPSLETRQRRVITTTVPRDRRRRATAKKLTLPQLKDMMIRSQQATATSSEDTTKLLVTSIMTGLRADAHRVNDTFNLYCGSSETQRDLNIFPFDSCAGLATALLGFPGIPLPSVRQAGDTTNRTELVQTTLNAVMTNIRNVEAVMERMLHLEMTRICKPYVRLAMTCPYSDRATMTKAQCEQINGQRDPLYYCQVRTHLQLVKRQIIGDLVNIELTMDELGVDIDPWSPPSLEIPPKFTHILTVRRYALAAMLRLAELVNSSLSQLSRIALSP